MTDFCRFSRLPHPLQCMLRPQDGLRDSGNHQGDYPMPALDAANRTLAAGLSVVLSAKLLACAILPASPGLMA
jgi:hypothetical protein